MPILAGRVSGWDGAAAGLRVPAAGVALPGGGTVAVTVTGPAELTVWRHAESLANAAFAQAERAGREWTGLTGPDAAIGLSRLGRAQAAVAREWYAVQPPGRRPEVLRCSPYRRAVETLEIMIGDATAPPVEFDARLRDRDTGVLELLTSHAIRSRHPDEATRRQREGELRYRPPGGESLRDVADRVAEALSEISQRYPGRRVMLMAHDSVVLVLRYLIDQLSAADLDRVMAEGPVLNASLSRWVWRDGRLRLTDWNRPV